MSPGSPRGISKLKVDDEVRAEVLAAKARGRRLSQTRASPEAAADTDARGSPEWGRRGIRGGGASGAAAGAGSSAGSGASGSAGSEGSSGGVVASPLLRDLQRRRLSSDHVGVAARWEAAAAASSQSSKSSAAFKSAADNRDAEGGSGPGRRTKLSGALYSTEG